ncbi:MAG: RIP metalloprotease RseP, partial [Gammaproteobacteria bacterium]
MSSVLLSIVAFLFAIGILVAVHEWGHYIVARMAGVKVLRYSIGFGKPLWMKKAGSDGTEYCVSAIPLGGYVKLLDEREGDVPANQRHRAFNNQAIPARIAILVAGPLMNFFFAIVAYWAMFVIGVPGIQPIVGPIEKGGIAAESGLVSGDRLLSIGGQPVATWEGSVLAILDGLLTSDQISMSVVSEDGIEKSIQLDVAGKLSELTQPGALFEGLGMQAWAPELDAVLGELTPGEAAEQAGFEEGDVIVAAGDEQIESWTGWVEFVRARPNETVDVLVSRDGDPFMIELAIGDMQLDDGSNIGRIGAG